MKANFVYRPRTYRDLLAPHLLGAEREYEIAAKVQLKAIDYENFVDRQFIADTYELCGDGAIPRCLLVTRSGRRGGILLIPERRSFVKAAAMILPD